MQLSNSQLVNYINELISINQELTTNISNNDNNLLENYLPTNHIKKIKNQLNQFNYFDQFNQVNHINSKKNNENFLILLVKCIILLILSKNTSFDYNIILNQLDSHLQIEIINNVNTVIKKVAPTVAPIVASTAASSSGAPPVASFNNNNNNNNNSSSSGSNSPRSGSNSPRSGSNSPSGASNPYRNASNPYRNASIIEAEAEAEIKREKREAIEARDKLIERQAREAGITQIDYNKKKKYLKYKQKYLNLKNNKY